MSSINDIVRMLRENRILNERKDYEKISDDELITLAQDGDSLAMETLINKYEDFIAMMARSKYTQGNDQDDMKQVATIGFWEAIQSYNSSRNGDFQAYAGMIIKRKLTDELRKEDTDRRRANVNTTSLDATEDTPDDAVASNTMTQGEFRGLVKDSGLSPEDKAIGNEGARELMRYMRDKFSQQERNAVMMYIKGYKVSDIAEETGMKYKSVENALMRVKNKLADYLRTRESKHIREENIQFSDEEKKILEHVIIEANMNESIRESAVASLKESYENYTEVQLGKELDNISYNVEDIVKEMKKTPYDEREELMNQLDDLSVKLSAMEEYLSDKQYRESEDIMSDIMKAEDTEYEGNNISDPYADRGIRQSDLY